MHIAYAFNHWLSHCYIFSMPIIMSRCRAAGVIATYCVIVYVAEKSEPQNTLSTFEPHATYKIEFIHIAWHVRGASVYRYLPEWRYKLVDRVSTTMMSNRQLYIQRHSARAHTNGLRVAVWWPRSQEIYLLKIYIHKSMESLHDSRFVHSFSHALK